MGVLYIYSYVFMSHHLLLMKIYLALSTGKETFDFVDDDITIYKYVSLYLVRHNRVHVLNIINACL